MSQANLLRIGEVHAVLRAEFPDIELSKIRYYEEQGLVFPQRSRKGYRLYTDRNIDCLREAFRLTTKENVSLRNARLRLIDLGLLHQDAEPIAPRRAAREAVAPSVTVNVPSATTASSSHSVQKSPSIPVLPETDLFSVPVGNVSTVNQSQLQGMTGLLESEVEELVLSGILRPSEVLRERAFTQTDVTMASLSRKLLARGVDVRLLSAVRRSAEREVGVIEDMTLAIRENAQLHSVDSIRGQVAEVAHDVAQLRSALFNRTLSEYLGE